MGIAALATFMLQWWSYFLALYNAGVLIAGVLNAGQTTSLIANLNAVCNQLQAFINEVNGLINIGVLTST